MGLNTTVVVLNDALHEIERDMDFGRKLALAILDSRRDRTVSAGGLYRSAQFCHVNAAIVIETHHADHDVLVRVGGNRGVVEPNLLDRLAAAERDRDKAKARVRELELAMRRIEHPEGKQRQQERENPGDLLR